MAGFTPHLAIKRCDNVTKRCYRIGFEEVTLSQFWIEQRKIKKFEINLQ